MKVENVSRFGESLELSKAGIRSQEKIIFKLLRKKIGVYAGFIVKLRLRKQTRRIRENFPAELERARKIGRNIDRQLVLMAALFFVLANYRGRRFARDFMTRLMQKVAPVTISAVYRLSELVKCEGDSFDNYKKYNRALFSYLNREGAWKNKVLNETDNLLEVEIISCFIREFFQTLGCGEIAGMACKLFLTGYSLIEEAVQSEFRRPLTIYNGDEYCHFKFYRKGKAPNDAHLNK